MSLHSLPFFTAYQIYDNLDNTDRKNLAHTCKGSNDFFKNLKNYDDNIKKIVGFIFDNYQIAESSFESVDLKKIFVFDRRLIVLGETHTQREHRYLNGTFIRLIWRGSDSLQVEGGERSLQHARQNQTSFCEFIPKEITEKAGYWDLPDDHEGWKTSNELFLYAASVVRNAKELLSLFDNKVVSFTAISQYLERYYSDVDAFYQAIPEIFLLKENENCLAKVEVNKICNGIAKIALDAIEENLKTFYIKFDALTELRNAFLTCKFKEVIFTSGKSGTFLTGSNHVKDPYVISYVKKLNKVWKIPYLFLIPKPFITPDSIQNSYNQLFMNAKAETNKTTTSTVVEEKIKEPISEEAHFNNLKASLLNFDVDKIDMDLNHFGQWLYISKEILKRLAVPIAPKVDS